MKKIKMTVVKLTFEEGCNRYLEHCWQKNLRDGTIRRYRQSYGYFFKYFNKDMLIEDIDSNTYKDYVLHLKSTLDNDVSINSYLRDLITTIHFFMDEGYTAVPKNAVTKKKYVMVLCWVNYLIFKVNVCAVF